MLLCRGRRTGSIKAATQVQYDQQTQHYDHQGGARNMGTNCQQMTVGHMTYSSALCNAPSAAMSIMLMQSPSPPETVTESTVPEGTNIYRPYCF